MAQPAGPAGPQTVLLIDAPGAGWEPARGGRSVDLAAALRDEGARPLVAVPAPGLGGVWTDDVDGIEVVRIGHPDPPRPRAFDPLDPTPLAGNLFVRHWERIAFGRSVQLVLTWTGRVAGPLRLALSGQHLGWWGLAGDWSDWVSLAPLPRRAPRGAPAGISRLIVLPGVGERPAAATLEPDRPDIEVVDPAQLPRRILQGLETQP